MNSVKSTPSATYNHENVLRGQREVPNKMRDCYVSTAASEGRAVAAIAFGSAADGTTPPYL